MLVAGLIPSLLERDMKTLFKLAVPAVAFSAFAFVAMSNTAAVAAPAMHRAGYCLAYEQDEMDCSFATFAQCEATASGIGGRGVSSGPAGWSGECLVIVFSKSHFDKHRNGGFCGKICAPQRIY